MKAAVYYESGPPSVFRYEDVPEPSLRPDGVLIDVAVVSIEGGDLLHRAEGRLTSVPHIVGYQCAGTVREVGEQVKDRFPGQRVVAHMLEGSHAEVVSVPAYATWPVPDGLDINVAACVPIPFSTADAALFEWGDLQPGQSVLIQGGAGGVGLAAIQLAKRAGATVFATASSDEKLERLKEFGLDHGINYREKDLVAEVRAITNGAGVNLAVDPVGTTFQQSLSCLATRGKALFVGNSGRASTVIDIKSFFRRSLTLSAVTSGSDTERGHNAVVGYLDDVAAGKLKVVIDRTYPLSQAADAHTHIESRQAFGRVLLVT